MLLDELIQKNDTKIIYLILDGLGGTTYKEKGGTELQAAKKPNIDKLAKESSCGLLDPVSPGITPGSGPSHLAIFGYDPIEYNIGRGVLEACGINFEFTHLDVAARINFATSDLKGTNRIFGIAGFCK